MQSLQLICSLTPSSTVPSTRPVIIWLKRCLARPLIDPPLESAPVSGGGATDTGGGNAHGPLQSRTDDSADAGTACRAISTSASADARRIEAIRLRASSAIVSART